jgi:hypothetical protein
MPPVPPRLDLRGRPGAGARLVIAGAALAAGAAGVFLVRALDAAPQPGWWLALAVGAGIAGLTLLFALQGTRLRVAADGTATYSLHGRANLAFALTDSSGFRPCAQGLLAGVALDLDPRKVRFLHKAGISPERMRRWRAELGCDLVLEGLGAADAEALCRLREALLASPPEAASINPS